MDPKGVAGSVRLHVGGPVEPTRIFVLHSPEYVASDTFRVGSEVAVTFHPDILQAMAAVAGPSGRSSRWATRAGRLTNSRRDQGWLLVHRRRRSGHHLRRRLRDQVGSRHVTPPHSL